MPATIEITVSKTGGAPVTVKLVAGETLGAALAKIDAHPSFSGTTFQKYLTTADRRFLNSLIGATAVPSSTVLANGDQIDYVSKVAAGM